MLKAFKASLFILLLASCSNAHLNNNAAYTEPTLDWVSLFSMERGLGQFYTKGIRNTRSKLGFYTKAPHCLPNTLRLSIPPINAHSLANTTDNKAFIRITIDNQAFDIATKISIHKDSQGRETVLLLSKGVGENLLLEFAAHRQVEAGVISPDYLISNLEYSSDLFSLNGYSLAKFSTLRNCNDKVASEYGTPIGAAPLDLEDGAYRDENGDTFMIFKGTMYKAGSLK